MSSKITSMPDIGGETVTGTENVAEHGEGAFSDAILCVKHPTDVQFSPSTRFRLGMIKVELLHCLSLDRMVVRERQTGETRVVVRAELRLMDKAADASPQPTIKPERVSEELLAQITAQFPPVSFPLAEPLRGPDYQLPDLFAFLEGVAVTSGDGRTTGPVSRYRSTSAEILDV